MLKDEVLKEIRNKAAAESDQNNEMEYDNDMFFKNKAKTISEDK
jgi:hypothetical protein